MSGIAVAVRARRGGFTLAVEAALSITGATVILGPSGSGKTTLLRVLSGLERQAQGRLSVGETDWLDSEKGLFVPAHRRHVGFVFQDGRLFPHLTVAGNLAYAERRARRRRPEFSTQEVARIFKIEGLLDRAAGTLSGGEVQRVAIARALLSRPRLMLMDEPLSALDLPRRSEALSYIERIPAIFGIPIIYVTHAVEEAARLADEVAIMNTGQIIAVGAAADILSRLDLAPYIGRFEAGAVLDGKVMGEDRQFGISTVDIDGTAFQVPSLGLASGETVRLRIRARDVSIATSKPEGLSIRNVIRAQIAEIAEEEGTAFAEIRMTTARQSLRARITRLSVKELGLTPGKEVYALVKAVAADRQLLDGRRRGEGKA